MEASPKKPEALQRPDIKQQSFAEIYGVPENFLEIEVRSPQTHGEYERPVGDPAIKKQSQR
jgi:sorting nexin-3/12